MRLARWLVAVICVMPACIYLSPINAPPIIFDVTRVCAPGVAPCDFSDVHAGDDLELAVSFTDPEHHGQITYEWSALACESLAQRMCAPIELPDPRAVNPELPVPAVLRGTTTPVQLVRVTIELRDDRGAHDLGGTLIPIAAVTP